MSGVEAYSAAFAESDPDLFDRKRAEAAGMKDHAIPCPEPGCGGVMHLRWARKHARWFYGCERYRDGCSSSVGADQRTGQPLNQAASRELRVSRVAAHAALDRLWRTSQERAHVYDWLSKAMGIPSAHIGTMTVEQCDRVVELATERAAQRSESGRRRARRRR